MLEAHAPHEGIHTWSGFFIHIATIVIGLLIAIGLEQSVEYFHHRHQLQGARHELALEVQENKVELAKSVAAIQKLTAQLETDIVSLRAARTVRETEWPKLEYSWAGIYWPENGAWRAIRQGGSLVLMPHDELSRYTYLYDGIDAAQVAFTAYATQSDMASALAQRTPGARALPSDIQEMLAATVQCQGRLKFLASVLRLEKFGLDGATGPAAD